MRSLVTGAGGFVGRNLVSALLRHDREVVAMVHHASEKPIFAGDEIETIVGDICSPDTYRDVLTRCDEVYHLAGVVAPHDLTWARHVNVDGTEMLAEAIGACSNPARLIYISSLSASGPCEGFLPRQESDPARPVSIYGKTKLEAEGALKSLGDRLPISVARPPGIFGPWDQNLLAMYRSVKSGLNAIGISRRYIYSFVHVQDLVEGLIAISDRGKRIDEASDESEQGVYFISDPEALSFEQLGNLIAKTLGRRKPFHFTVPSPICLSVAFCSDWYGRIFRKRVYLNIDKMREARAGSWVCDCTRAQQELSFQTTASLATRLDETYEWYQRQGWMR